jgi:hypothetical protein
MSPSGVEPWQDLIHVSACERWGPERAEVLRPEIETAARHLTTIAEIQLDAADLPAFFLAGDD